MSQSSRRWRSLTPVAVLVLVGVAAVAFAIGTVARGTAFAADPTASPSQATNAGPGWAGGAWKAPFGGGMHRMMGGGADITITAINGTNLSLKTTDGWTRTINAAGATITRAGQTISVGDLKVGDTINFRESRQSDGSYKITTIEVVLPTAAGTVSSVGSSSVTITQADGSSKTITLTGSTTYDQAGQSASKSALVAGARILAEGTVAGSTFTATRIEIMPAAVSGTVSSKTSNSIVVKTSDGKSVTVKTTSSTRFGVAGQANATISNVAVGDRIVAEGTLNSDGSLTAALVRAGANDQPGFGGFGGRGFGGFGPGKGGMMGGGMMGGFGGFGPGPQSQSSGAPITDSNG